MKLFVEVLASSANEKRLVARVKKTALFAVNRLPKTASRKLLKMRTAPYVLEVAFFSPKKIQALNHSYRKKNKPTDVLSFDGAPYSPSLGQLALCWKVIKDQAMDFNVPAEEELDRMVIHGLLHLFGYEHEKNRAQAKKMFALQEKIVASLHGIKVRRGQLFK